MRIEGVIKSWNDERGFGFIEPVQGGQEIFLHVKAFRVRHGRPQPGQYVSFAIKVGPKGKKRAKVSEILRLLADDGWDLVATRGSHRQFKHPVKPGRVTVPGKPSDELAPGTLNSIRKQAGFKK